MLWEFLLSLRLNHPIGECKTILPGLSDRLSQELDRLPFRKTRRRQVKGSWVQVPQRSSSYMYQGLKRLSTCPKMLWS